MRPALHPSTPTARPGPSPRASTPCPAPRLPGRARAWAPAIPITPHCIGRAFRPTLWPMGQRVGPRRGAPLAATFSDQVQAGVWRVSQGHCLGGSDVHHLNKKITQRLCYTHNKKTGRRRPDPGRWTAVDGGGDGAGVPARARQQGGRDQETHPPCGVGNCPHADPGAWRPRHLDQRRRRGAGHARHLPPSHVPSARAVAFERLPLNTIIFQGWLAPRCGRPRPHPGRCDPV